MPRGIPLQVLDQIKISHPCTQPWDAMAGDDYRRSCESCGKLVHNLSALTRVEAEALVVHADSRLCVKMSLDSKGKLRTRDDQPRSVRRWFARIAGLCSAALGLTIGGCDREVWGDICDDEPGRYSANDAPERIPLTPALLNGMVFMSRDVVSGTKDPVLETWTLTFGDGTVRWDRADLRTTSRVDISPDGVIRVEPGEQSEIKASIDWSTRDLLWDGKVYLPMTK